LTTTARPAPQELLGDPCYAQLKAHIIASTGHAYYTGKDEDLARRVSRRLTETGAGDCRMYLDLLQEPGRGPSEWNALVPEITIGESFFFRHQEHFDALRTVVLPELIARNNASRQLRIWCAGCADGSEPYSLSILLRRDLGHLLVGWDARILATDINSRALAVAAEGRFEDWAFRSLPGEIRQSCFQKGGKSWVIAPAYKQGVSFRQHNLAQDSFPPTLDRAPLDLIICRNVMIYFAPELIRATVRQFHECLAPGGWLLVGPSEPNMTCFTAFETVNLPGATLYRKPGRRLEEGIDMARAWIPAVPLPLRPSLPVLPGTRPLLRDNAARDAPLRDEAADTMLAELRAHAGAQDWDNAARCCRQLGQCDSLNPAVYLYQALIWEHSGQSLEAEKSLRKALYLDRNCAPAHFRLGVLLLARGDRAQASRCFANTVAALSGHAGNEPLPDLGGITVADLLRSARSHWEATKPL